jgi:hypothetical protein
MKISVIICAHTEERWQDLIEAVASMEQQTVPPQQIVVAIDHNPALFAKAQAQFPTTTVVENQQDRGLNGTRNSGVAVATGESSPSWTTTPSPNLTWLAQLQATYTSDEIVGVGGKINPLWLSGRPDWFPEEFFWVVGCSYRGLPQETAPVRNLIGCNMSYRREVIDCSLAASATASATSAAAPREMTRRNFASACARHCPRPPCSSAQRPRYRTKYR